MNKLIEVLDILEDWDLIKTDNGAVGLVIDGFVHSQVPISMGDGIKEIKSGAIDLDELWNNTPSDFHDTHIIGKGLLSQIQERAKAGKFSHVYVDGDIIPIDEVYELKGNDYTKAAVVVF